MLLPRDRDTRIEKEDDLNRIVREELVQLNPADAAAESISSGDRVEVATPRGRLVGVAALDDSIPRGAGVLCYVNVEDVEQIYKRALDVGAEVEGEPRFVKAAGHTEFIVKDPDGYSLAIYSRGTTG